MHSFRSATLALALFAIVVAVPPTAGAQGEGEPETSAAYDGIVGFGAVLTTLVYAPVKLAYAITGGLVSGLAWLLTLDSEVAAGIANPSVGGDYVVTPAHLEGRRTLRFVGDG